MAIERECVIKPMVIDQSKAGAIDKTKLFVVVSRKDRPGSFINCFGDM